MPRFSWFALAASLTYAPTAYAISPKVAVVVSGDPDVELREAAATIIQSLNQREKIVLPGDEVLSRVLQGSGRNNSPVYRDIARARAQLGRSARRDQVLLVRIGEHTSAHALVVLTRSRIAIQVEVFDVDAQTFYEGHAVVEGSATEKVTSFIIKRARTAARRNGKSATSRKTEPGISDSSKSTAQSNGSPKKSPARRWFRKNWPYLVAGVLLAGALTYVIVRERDNDPGEPMLRFTSGDGE